MNKEPTNIYRCKKEHRTELDLLLNELDMYDKYTSFNKIKKMYNKFKLPKKIWVAVYSDSLYSNDIELSSYLGKKLGLPYRYSELQDIIDILPGYITDNNIFNENMRIIKFNENNKKPIMPKKILVDSIKPITKNVLKYRKMIPDTGYEETYIKYYYILNDNIFDILKFFNIEKYIKINDNSVFVKCHIINKIIFGTKELPIEVVIDFNNYINTNPKTILSKKYNWNIFNTKNRFDWGHFRVSNNKATYYDNKLNIVKNANTALFCIKEYEYGLVCFINVSEDHTKNSHPPIETKHTKTYSYFNVIENKRNKTYTYYPTYRKNNYYALYKTSKTHILEDSDGYRIFGPIYDDIRGFIDSMFPIIERKQKLLKLKNKIEKIQKK